MSRGLGRIEQVILARIADTEARWSRDPRSAVHMASSWDLLCDAYPPDYAAGESISTFTPAQRKAVTRAMRSFVRKHPRFGLAGGQGRKMLYLVRT